MGRRKSKLESWTMEITGSEEQTKKKRLKKHEQSIRDLWDIIKLTNLCFVGVPEKT